MKNLNKHIDLESQPDVLDVDEKSFSTSEIEEVLREKEENDDVLEEKELDWGLLNHLNLDSLKINCDDIIEINELNDLEIEIITLKNYKYTVSATENLIINKEKIKTHIAQSFTKEEKDIVAEENMALIHYVLKSIHTNNIPYEELVSVGMVGYAKAINSFDKSRAVKFSTYAINCIKNEIFFFLRKEQKYQQNTISMSTIISTDSNGNSLELIDTIDTTPNEKTLEELIENDEERQVLLKAIDFLKPEEQYILIYRFGLDRGIIKTQKEIADAINMSQANVSKIQKNCLHKLRLILRRDFRN